MEWMMLFDGLAIGIAAGSLIMTGIAWDQGFKEGRRFESIVAASHYNRLASKIDEVLP